jgi:hypothetical protein
VELRSADFDDHMNRRQETQEHLEIRLLAFERKASIVANLELLVIKPVESSDELLRTSRFAMKNRSSNAVSVPSLKPVTLRLYSGSPLARFKVR